MTPINDNEEHADGVHALRYINTPSADLFQILHNNSAWRRTGVRSGVTRCAVCIVQADAGFAAWAKIEAFTHREGILNKVLEYKRRVIVRHLANDHAGTL